MHHCGRIGLHPSSSAFARARGIDLLIDRQVRGQFEEVGFASAVVRAAASQWHLAVVDLVVFHLQFTPVRTLILP